MNVDNDFCLNQNSFVDKYFLEIKGIIRLAIPLLITQLSVTAIGFIDTIMAGHYSKTALAGVAVGSSIYFPLMIAMSGVMMAVTPITSQLKGAGKVKESSRTVLDALWIGLFFSLLLILFLNNTDFILRWMNMSEEISSVVRDYLLGISIGLPAIASYFVLKSYIEGLGSTTPQMVISLITVFFNYFANDVLIHGKFEFPEMGGAGCGWASGFTMWVFFFCVLIYLFFFSRYKNIKFFPKFFFPAKKGIKDILKLGLPIGATLFMECSIFACITLFIGVLGPVIVGGHQIVLNYSGIVFSIPLSIGLAVTIRTGYAVGAGKSLSARFTCLSGISLAVGIALLTLAFTRLCPHFIASFYTTEPEVSEVAVSLLKIAALYQISDAVMIISQSGLRGYKDANVTFALAFTAYWLITLPLGYIISMTNLIVPQMGAKGFWISLIIGLTISGILLSIRLMRLSNRYIVERKSF